MSIKSILLHLTGVETVDNCMEVALGLATDHGAQITAVYSILPVTPPTSFMGYIPPEFIERTRTQENENADAAIKKIEEAAAKVGVSLIAKKEDGYALDILNDHALSADLVILGQINPDDERASQYQYLADEFVVTSPQPVLIVPYAGKYQQFGGHVLVAWNNTREASRAVHFAMPFLKKAEQVTLLSVNPSTDQTNANTAMLEHLKRHGVNAKLKVGHWEDVSVGNAILDSLVDMNADMLVMGAYGHSRIREMILGGATQEILEHMTAPVLFAH